MKIREYSSTSLRGTFCLFFFVQATVLRKFFTSLVTSQIDNCWSHYHFLLGLYVFCVLGTTRSSFLLVFFGKIKNVLYDVSDNCFNFYNSFWGILYLRLLTFYHSAILKGYPKAFVLVTDFYRDWQDYENGFGD